MWHWSSWVSFNNGKENDFVFAFSVRIIIQKKNRSTCWKDKEWFLRFLSYIFAQFKNVYKHTRARHLSGVNLRRSCVILLLNQSSSRGEVMKEKPILVHTNLGYFNQKANKNFSISISSFSRFQGLQLFIFHLFIFKTPQQYKKKGLEHIQVCLPYLL